MVPTIFKKIDRNSNIYWDEIFGPVVGVETFTTEEQALEMANDTEHGLAGEHFWISNRVGINLIYTVGSIYTQDISRAIRLWRHVEAGTFFINCAAMMGPQVPTNGLKSSGFGKIGSWVNTHYAITPSPGRSGPSK